MSAYIVFFLICWVVFGQTRAQSDQGVGYPNIVKISDEMFLTPISTKPNEMLHLKDVLEDDNTDILSRKRDLLQDMNEFDNFLPYIGELSEEGVLDDQKEDGLNRVKRRAKKRRKQKKHHKSKSSTSEQPEELPELTQEPQVAPMRRMAEDHIATPQLADELKFMDVPKDLYQSHLTPGVIFRVHLTEAIIKMQHRNYADDVDSSVVEADSEYMRLARKLVSDEIDKFQQLAWLVSTFNRRKELVSTHTCNAKYYISGIPPTNFSTTEENMKRACLFNSVFLDRMPYVVGDDGSLMAAVAPPVLQCDAATCISVPYVDSIMFEEKLPMTHVRTITRCQSQCRAQCTNDQVCLDRCAAMCDATLS